MTGLIRMLPDDVRGMAHQIDLTAEELYLMPTAIRSAANSLRSLWESGMSAQYANQLKRLADKLHREIIDLQRLAKQVRNEVAEWEQADNSYEQNRSAKGNAISLGTGALDSNPQGRSKRVSAYEIASGAGAVAVVGSSIGFIPPSTSEENKVNLTTFIGREGDVDSGESDNVVMYKYGIVDESLIREEGEKDFKVGNIDSKAVGEVKVGTLEAGVKAGFDDEGKITTGIFAEGTIAEASGTMIFGSSIFGVTLGGSASAGSVEAFAGIKDDTIGASIGASAAAADVELGLNIAGANVGVEAGLSAGIEFGFKIGKETRIKIGPFKVGLNFGAAKS